MWCRPSISITVGSAWLSSSPRTSATMLATLVLLGPVDAVRGFGVADLVRAVGRRGPGRSASSPCRRCTTCGTVADSPHEAVADQERLVQRGREHRTVAGPLETSGRRRGSRPARCAVSTETETRRLHPRRVAVERVAMADDVHGEDAVLVERPESAQQRSRSRLRRRMTVARSFVMSTKATWLRYLPSARDRACGSRSRSARSPRGRAAAATAPSRRTRWEAVRVGVEDLAELAPLHARSPSSSARPKPKRPTPLPRYAMYVRPSTSNTCG